MAWDFYIYGIHHSIFKEKLKNKLPEFPIAADTQLEIQQKFENRMDIVDLQNLYDSIYPHFKGDESCLDFFMTELFWYRSKAINFAQAQMVGYLNADFDWASDENLIKCYDFAMILRKNEIVAFLDWLILITSLLTDEPNPQQYFHIIYPEKWLLEAQKLQVNGHLKGDEFEYFGDYIFGYSKLRKEFAQADYDYYYWEDSI
jgi:hypothetical protein